ncbi:carbon-nitrogen hydrolase family protein [Methylohalobius crimeensis]|uniref:carbon-nitrogen hydrolase family protein n=1 Tax=Methylohalobius crimeensis TaxID=244365 RepID=UPI0003B6EE8E|nr:carbon-nitrogen hydrolase family protein [Methylohalobius crimeensis]
MNEVIAAAVQMTSGADLKANLETAGKWIAEAAARGAKLILLPENFAFMGRGDRDKLALMEADGDGPIQDFLAATARRHGIWLIGGSIPLQSHDPEKISAACLIYGPDGSRQGRYDKIHLFDVDVPGTSESYRESDTIAAGHDPLVMDTPWGKLSPAICYDIRFPEFIRLLAARGLDILLVPAAFTARTGAAHWEVLLRARAIENQCYVVAANQGGIHANGRETYGHSMIIDPWGKVLTRLEQPPGICSSPLEPRVLEKVRQAFPVLNHRKFF